MKLEVNGHRKVNIEEGALVVEHYVNSDPAVVAHFERQAEDRRLEEVDRCLAIGVRAVEVVGPTLDVALVQREFESLLEKQRQAVVDAGAEFKTELLGSVNDLVGADGSVRKMFEEAKSSMEAELRKYCDEDSARSITSTVAKAVDKTLEASNRRAERALGEALDVGNENSAVGKLNKTMLGGFTDSMKAVNELTAKVSGMLERRDERKSSTRKGTDYEADVFGEIASLAAVHGDSPEATGTVFGEARKRRGDAVVTVDSRLTGGADVRFVVEAIDRSVAVEKNVLKELDEAKQNRAAVAAIAVLSSAELAAASGQMLQRYPGNRYICVVDGDDWSPLALRVAYSAARLDALQSVEGTSGDEVDLEAATLLVSECLQHLAELAKLRTRLSTIRKATGEGVTILDGVKDEVEQRLSRLGNLLRATDEA